MNRLPRLTDSDSSISMWVDEAIWGHRLYNEQTPWMTFLEFLLVLQSEAAAGRAFHEAQPNTLKYKSSKRLHLRNILFNNPRLEALLGEYPNDDEAQWRAWLQFMRENRGGLESPDYSYLRQRFSSFKNFAALAQFLQSNAIEGDSNKRWSSRFVFPYGPHCLYEDLNVKPSSVTNDRRFFARTGEMLYLMLCRSRRGAELLFQLQRLNLAPGGAPLPDNQRWNKLVASLQPETELQSDRESGKPPYLPYESLPEYGAIAEDWLTLFGLEMPGYDVAPHLVTITGLHLTIYYLNRAWQSLGRAGRPIFVAEIISPQKTSVRELAAKSYLENDQLSLQAVKAYINAIKERDEWRQCLQSPDGAHDAAKLFRNEFAWESDSAVAPEKLLDELLSDAERRHKQHIGRCHAEWLRELGFASSRGSRRTRYAPTDSLLKTLVLATAPYRTELQEFLQELYDKYGIIIGHAQAGEFIQQGLADKRDFEENARRLEERLASMGLLKRLSDACAYVINPFQLESDR